MQEELWEDNNPAIKYSSGQWARTYNSMYRGSTLMRTTKLGDSMSVKFRGSSIKFIGVEGWDHGTFRVNFDGEETVVDGHCCGQNGEVPQVMQFEAHGLSTEEHVLNVTNLAAGPWGSKLEVDKLIIAPHSAGREPIPVFGMYLLVGAVILLLGVFLSRRYRAKKLKAAYQMLPVRDDAPPTY
ncbi:hypothetical protein C8F04DRAFT_1232741 [Mycena alexandri]|uniref:Uncharacterized protein n=1 Tax=Mycena alexandri TaxID=1745969 RepID=A0AAD6T1E8_9AGAR|nr:hypothetical protein C8F04DRAFT_1395190 [Mycena alexandri]KAJ7037016.1 hypothetical protein C8F04DRAFT_1232741 [Mycena alexandri]